MEFSRIKEIPRSQSFTRGGWDEGVPRKLGIPVRWHKHRTRYRLISAFEMVEKGVKKTST